MFSSAVSIGSRLKNWKMNPTRSRRSFVSAVSSRVVMSVPAMLTRPAVGRSSPARMCISVDFPDPDGPITAVSRSDATSRETPRSASTAVSPSPKRRVTSAAVRTGVPDGAPSDPALPSLMARFSCSRARGSQQ